MNERSTQSGLRWLAAAAVSAACLAGSVASAGDVDPLERGERFVGWGTSLAWWANISGTWSNPAEFDALMDTVFNVDDGLGLTIVRLNIGAGQNPVFPSNYMGAGRSMPAYRDGPELPYNFLADRAQQRVLLAGLERGVQIVEANANSPPWWMTIRQDASGNPNGANLSPDRYDEFCEYLADVSLWYRDELGVEFSSITPLNEPSASWWNGDGGQEGCTFPAATHPPLLLELRAQLDAKGLEELPISGPEEWSSSLTRSSVASYPTEVQQMLSHITTHTYNADNRVGLNALSESLQKPLWMSEYGTGAATEYDSAMVLARRIIGDFKEMPRLSAWIIWQVMSTNHFSHTWACMLANFSSRTPGFTYRPQYSSFGQFSRFIRPGSYFIDSGDPDALAAYHPGLQRLVIVALNESTSPRAAAFGLDAFSNIPSTARVYRTSRNENLSTRPNLLVGAQAAINAVLIGESVTTFVLDGISTDSMKRTDWNGDGVLDSGDTSLFIEELGSRADHTDLTGDGLYDFFDLIEFLQAHDAAGVETIEFRQDFSALDEGDLAESELGNGGDGGYYFAEGKLFLQAFAANAENGGVGIPLTGVTLEAGVAYTVRLSAADFNQSWTTGGSYLAGLSSAAPSVVSLPDLAAATFSVPENDGPLPMRFQSDVFTVTPSATITNPYLLLRTDSVGSGNQRIGIDRVTISRSSIAE